MIKKQLKIICGSILIFCILSFLSTIFHLVMRKETEFPVTNIGFPLKYYNQFWDSQNQLHWNWDFSNFVFDFIFVYTLLFLVGFVCERK